MAIGVLSACGGGDDTHTLLQGRVTEQGAAVANTDLVLMNRLTDERLVTRTNPDGEYSITVPNGVYDMGAHDGAKQDVKVLGLIALSGGISQRDIQIEPGDAGLIRGRVRLANGEPAANYLLWVTNMNGVDGVDIGFMEWARTDAQGEFSVEVGAGRAFDLDIHDPSGNLVEFVDVQKLDGHLSVDLVLGDDTQANVYRHHQTRPPTASSGPGVAVAAADDDQAFSQIEVTADGIVEVSAGALTPRPQGTQHDLRLQDEAMRDPLAAYAGLRLGAADNALEVWLEQGDFGSWFQSYDYRVNVNVDQVSSGLLTYNSYSFDDASGDSYWLPAYQKGWHYVNYNSDQPNITSLSINSSFDIQPVVIGLGLLSTSAAAVDNATEEAVEQTFDELLEQGEGRLPNSAVNETSQPRLKLGRKLSVIVEDVEGEIEEGPIGQAASEGPALNPAKKLSALERDLVKQKLPLDLYDADFDDTKLTEEFFRAHPEYDEPAVKYARGVVKQLQNMSPGTKNMMARYAMTANKGALQAYQALGLTKDEALVRVWVRTTLKAWRSS